MQPKSIILSIMQTQTWDVCEALTKVLVGGFFLFRTLSVLFRLIIVSCFFHI